MLLNLSALAEAQQTYAPPRLADGKPDLNGIWEAQGKIDVDLEGRLAGKHIIVDPADGKIPYRADARLRRKPIRRGGRLKIR